MINQLKSYRNGVHGEFFLKVAAEIERLRSQVEITADQQCPICCKSSPDDTKKIRDLEAERERIQKESDQWKESVYQHNARVADLEEIRDDLVQACEGLIAACKHHKVLTGTMIHAEEVIKTAKASSESV